MKDPQRYRALEGCRLQFITLLGGAAAVVSLTRPRFCAADRGTDNHRSRSMTCARDNPGCRGTNSVSCRAFISLFGVLAAASSLAAHAQESATMRPTGTLPQIEVARVKPVDRSPPNLRLSDDLIDLMKDFSLSSAQAIGGAWGIPLRSSTPFDERYGQW